MGSKALRRCMAVLVVAVCVGCAPIRPCWNERDEAQRVVQTCCQDMKWLGPPVLGEFIPTGPATCTPTKYEEAGR